MFDYDLQNRYGKGVKTFDFKRNGSNGTKLIWAGHITDPVSLIAVQKHGTETEFSSENVPIEARNGKGSPIVITVLDDVIERIIKK